MLGRQTGRVHSITEGLQRLMDGQVPGSARDEAADSCQIDKSEADADRPQSHHNDRQAGAKGRRIQGRPSQRCNVLVINCQPSPAPPIGGQTFYLSKKHSSL